MLGRFDEARPVLIEFFRVLEERGDVVNLGQYLSMSATQFELLAGDTAAAVKYGERGCHLLEEAGERGFLATGLCIFAQALYAHDRLTEADACAERGIELADADDTSAQMDSRRVRAKVLARRGRYEEAEALSREAVAIADTTEGLRGQGDTRADLAEVLELAGRRDEASASLRDALERYERKEALVLARRTREQLASLEETPM